MFHLRPLNSEITTVVQPDISVICNKDKIDKQGCRGTPDFIIEIISPSTASRDNIVKTALYEKHGVKEYWIVHPTDKIIFIRRLEADGSYGKVEIRDKGQVDVSAVKGLTLDLDALFPKK